MCRKRQVDGSPAHFFMLAVTMALAAAQQSETQTIHLIDNNFSTNQCIMSWYTFNDNGVPSIFVRLEMNDDLEEAALVEGSIWMMSFEFGTPRDFYNNDPDIGPPRTRYYFHATLENGVSPT